MNPSLLMRSETKKGYRYIAIPENMITFVIRF